MSEELSNTKIELEKANKQIEELTRVINDLNAKYARTVNILNNFLTNYIEKGSF